MYAFQNMSQSTVSVWCLFVLCLFCPFEIPFLVLIQPIMHFVYNLSPGNHGGSEPCEGQEPCNHLMMREVSSYCDSVWMDMG